MFKKNKGKILRIKPGYNPYLGGFTLPLGWAIFIALIVIGVPFSIILTIISKLIAKRLYDRHISESEIYEKGAI